MVTVESKIKFFSHINTIESDFPSSLKYEDIIDDYLLFIYNLEKTKSINS